MRIHVKIDTAASGDLVAAETGKTITVLGYFIVAAGAVTVTLKSNTTALTGAMSAITGIPLAQDCGNRKDGLMKCVKGEALVITLGSGVQVSGHMIVDKT